MKEALTVDYVQAAALLRQQDNILILTHKRPDGDTVGCGVALCLALRNVGKTAHLLQNPDATSLFTPYLEHCLAPQGFVPDFVVSVDSASRSLFCENVAPYLDCIDLAFDHHPSNEGFARENCIEADKAACGELIYKVVVELGPMTADIALPLYVAVATDTGCFMYGNTTSNTHLVAAALMQTGIDATGANKRHFRTKSFIRLQIESMLVANMQREDGGTIVLVAVSLADMARLGATERDAEDIAAFVGQLEGVETSVTIRELVGGECKLSVRTSGALNATKVCAVLGGGGHAAAAGCTIAGGVADAKREIMRAIRAVQAQG